MAQASEIDSKSTIPNWYVEIIRGKKREEHQKPYVWVCNLGFKKKEQNSTLGTQNSKANLNFFCLEVLDESKNLNESNLD